MRVPAAKACVDYVPEALTESKNAACGYDERSKRCRNAPTVRGKETAQAQQLRDVCAGRRGEAGRERHF